MPLLSSSWTEVFDSLNSSSRLSTAQWPSPSRLLASSAVSEVTSTRSSHRTSPTSKPSTWSTSVPPSSHSSKPSLRKVSSLKPPRQPSRTWLSATLKLTWPPSKWCKSRGDTILKNAKIQTIITATHKPTEQCLLNSTDQAQCFKVIHTLSLSLNYSLLIGSLLQIYQKTLYISNNNTTKCFISLLYTTKVSKVSYDIDNLLFLPSPSFLSLRIN